MSIFCLGEVLVDRVDGSRHPGGAPANVASHISALGARAEMVSRVGKDEPGRELAKWLGSKSIGVCFVQVDADWPSGSVDVFPGPRYEIAAPSAWDFIERSGEALSATASAGAVVFGTLAQRQPVSRSTIRALVEAARASGVPVLCDLNLRAPFFDEETILWSLRHCDVLKLNGEELEVVSGFLGAAGSREDLFAGMLREFGLDRGVLTEGGKGALVYESGNLFRQEAHAVGGVVDTVGAGDAFTAVLSVAMSRRMSLSGAAAPAAALAAFVVSRQGATPEIPHELIVRINAMLGA